MSDSVSKELIEYTIDRLDEIDNKYKDASSRTSQYKKIANKIHKRLASNLSLNTYHRYMTDIRDAIKLTNRKHHALTSTTNRKGYLVNVIKNLPAYEDDLRALATLPAQTIGNGVKMLKLKIHNELKGDELDTAIDLIEGLLTDHQLITYLVKSKAKREIRARAEEESLTKKSSNVKVYNTPALLKLADELLDDKSYTSVAWALALLTGRRSTEILLRGKFSKVGVNSVMFSGQLKKRKGTQKAPYLIPTLAPADRVISALNRLRGMEEVRVFRNEPEYKAMSYDQLNKAVNQRASGVLNAKAKRLMDDSNEVFKNTRGIYARHTSDTIRQSSPDWEGLNEDEFLKAILGHESTDEVKHYRQVELRNEPNSDWLKEPEPEEEKAQEPEAEQAKQNWRATSPVKKMREAISEFKDDHVMIGGRKVSIKSVTEFHDEKLRFWVAENPTLKITQSAIEKNKGNTLKSGTGSVDVRVNRGTFKAWVSIVGADALEAYNESKE
jgi:hypothetical protein